MKKRTSSHSMPDQNDPSGQPQKPLGGIVHTYQKYDPQRFPSPATAPPDLVTPLMDHMLAHGNIRRLSAEEMAKAVKLDAEQFSRLGPSLDRIRMILEERRRKILETYETETVQILASEVYRRQADAAHPPKPLEKRYRESVQQEQLYDLERLWYRVNDDNNPFNKKLMGVIHHLGNKYQIDELAAKYYFVGDQPMTIEQALAIKEELEQIDKLLKQVEDARAHAQIAILDLEELGQQIADEHLQPLQEIQRMIENYVREEAERQGIEHDGRQFQLTPQAYRIFQGKLLGKIFDQLNASRSGRHTNRVVGEGAVELPQTKPYEFGDSVSQMDLPQSMINAMVRQGTSLPIRMKSEDIVVHQTRNHPKCATAIILDMSGSMRYDGQYIHVKRMALAIDGLIRSEYPGDFVGFVEMSTFGKVRHTHEIVSLMPKPVTLHEPIVQLHADMSREGMSEHMIHQHFTNMQHSLLLARRMLATQNTPNRQILIITDGLPTAHFEGSELFMLYPPHPRTEQATLKEAVACQQDGITVNLFLVPSQSQSEEDIRFAYRMAETSQGRVIFTSGADLDRFVVWDYLSRKRDILG